MDSRSPVMATHRRVLASFDERGRHRTQTLTFVSNSAGEAAWTGSGMVMEDVAQSNNKMILNGIG